MGAADARMGYWIDMKDPYITYDNKYIETLWHLLAELYKKGLLYKAIRFSRTRRRPVRVSAITS